MIWPGAFASSNASEERNFAFGSSSISLPPNECTLPVNPFGHRIGIEKRAVDALRRHLENAVKLDAFDCLGGGS